MATSFNITEKKPTLYVVMMSLWLVILAGSSPNLWHTFSGLESILARILFVFFVSCLALFWFYGVYHAVFLIFSYVHKPELGEKVPMLTKNGPLPKVALIYITYNDFNREAALTCLKQDYPDYRVFLLDVGTNPDMRKQVDTFHEEFASAATLVRTQQRQGFKARSLNDTLKTAVGEEYEFFAVCDADNRLPTDFLSRAIPRFFLDERIAFVQANHNAIKYSQGKFAKDFEVAIDASWYLHERPRDKYGLLMCMGHGVVVRRKAWEKVGGYPEIVQEDTAFTMLLREHGYYGCFAPEVICYEEFPEDFRRWRRRQFRLVQADTEILLTRMPAFLSNKNVFFVEKLDLLARTIRIPSQSLTLPFLVLLLLIPLANKGMLSAASLDETYGAMFSPAVASITLLTAAAPLYPFFVYLRKRLLKLAGLSLRSITLHYSFMALAGISLLVYILRGKAMFPVTGARDGAAGRSQPTGGFSGFLQRLNADSPLVTAKEVGMGLVLAYIGLACGSLIAVGVALVLIMSPLIRRLGWHNRIISGFTYLPPALVIVGLIAALSGATGAGSQYLALAALSVLLF